MQCLIRVGQSSIAVAGFTATPEDAQELMHTVACDEVRRACGDVRAEERYTKPAMAGLYLKNVAGDAIELREVRAIVSQPGYFVGSSIDFDDILLATFRAVPFDPARLPTAFPAVAVGPAHAALAEGAAPPPPPIARTLLQKPPMPYYDELRARLAPKLKRA